MIIVDKSEPGELVEKIKKYVPVEVKDITFYDYVITSADGHRVVGIERKTVADLFASVKDGRYGNETYKLSHDFDTSYLAVIGDKDDFIIEDAIRTGELESNYDRIWLGILVGSTMKISPTGRGGRVNFVQFKSEDEFVGFLVQLQNFLNKEVLFRVPLGGGYSEEYDYMVAMLSAVPGIGKETAVALRNRFRNMINLINSPVEEIAETKTSSGKRIGRKLAESLYKALRE